jgi:predicted Zn-dependent peptidase
MFKDRTKAPKIAEIQHVELLHPEIIYSTNGLAIHVFRKVTNDVFHVQVEFGAGKMQQIKPLVSAFASELLFSGTGNYSQLEIQELLDIQGAFVSVESALSNTILNVYGLTTNFDAVFEIVDNVLALAFYPEAVFELHRKAEQQRHAINMDKNAYVARREFLKALFHNHPIGMLAEDVDFQNIGHDDCFDFYKKHLSQNVKEIHVVGDVSEAQIFLLQQMFAPRYTNTQNQLLIPLPSEPLDLYIEKPTALQSTIRIGKIMFNPKHPDYFEFDILDTILGGYFGSRLMQNLREDKGYTYGIASGLTSYEDTGYFVISTEVGKEHRDAALDAIKREVNKLSEDLISVQELQMARAYIQGQILKSTDGAFAQMNQFLYAKRFGLPQSYLNDFLETLEQITPKRLRDLAQSHLDWEKMTKVVVG